MTAEEWIKQQIDKNRETYKTPQAMIDEQIELLQRVRDHEQFNIEEKWRIITAVSEAYHVVIWVATDKQPQRLANTIISFVKENIHRNI